MGTYGIDDPVPVLTEILLFAIGHHPWLTMEPGDCVEVSYIDTGCTPDWPLIQSAISGHVT
jgi:hypothetical protein